MRFLLLFLLLWVLLPAPVLAQGSSGCGTFHFPGSYTFMMPNGRSYIVHVPSGYNSSNPIPLILNLHAYTSSASSEESVSGMDSSADQKNFLVVYPDGTKGSNGQTGWNLNISGNPPVTNLPSVLNGITWSANDFQFFNDLVNLHENTFCVDTSRIGMTGFSMGGIMSFEMACNGPSWLASVSTVAASPPFSSMCSKVPVQAFHGQKDMIDHYNGNSEIGSLPSLMKCGQIIWQLNDVVEQQCGNSVLYTETQDGHTWPSSPDAFWFAVLGFGATTFTINASNLIGDHLRGN